MNELSRDECRWRFSAESVGAHGGVLQAAWETGCGQWCIDSESTPDKTGFRNGFLFCPYCSRPLLLQVKREDAA